ncbi:MAG TPA: tRNA 4-thiouridine(8) synthase ThiI [Firmicutes bacterium]|nr:tRNA 4-thiouridine(8) synthase ThiI [Bacillota bacterium]
MNNYLMIHYGELSTKGNNRKEFIRCLNVNVKRALKKYEVETKPTRDHIYVYLHKNNIDEVISTLQEISGIQKISLVEKCALDLVSIKEKALEMILDEGISSFKVDAHKAKEFLNLSDYELDCLLGDYILKNVKLSKVDLHNPEGKLKVMLNQEGAYLSLHNYPGLGGYPLGMNGKVTLLLSGGIDSPVAAFSLIRRGIKVECLHFASPPYTSMAVIDKLKDLLKKLNEYQSDIKLQIVPFTKLQEEIYKNVSEPYCITIMRRMMVRIGVKVAESNNCLALATGESIGQVASQTLESVKVINEVTNFPILRPLATLDKLSIIDISKKINTFDISIRPYEDCCTIFKPKKPKTKPRLDECLKFEEKFDYDSLIKDAINNIETIYISDKAKKDD